MWSDEWVNGIWVLNIICIIHTTKNQYNGKICQINDCILSLPTLFDIKYS